LNYVNKGKKYITNNRGVYEWYRKSGINEMAKILNELIFSFVIEHAAQLTSLKKTYSSGC